MTNFPHNLLAQAGGLVPCTGYVDSSGRFVDGCTYLDLFTLAGTIVRFIVELAVPVATIAIVAAGIYLVAYAGNESGRSTAKGILKTAVIGLFLTLAAYLIISSILHYLGNPDVVGGW